MVEGKRDLKALRLLGYSGIAVTIGELGRGGMVAFAPSKKVVILTDLDRAGAHLAARCVKALSHEGFRASLLERRRLRIASRGVFRQIENLSRFARSEELA